MSPPERDRRGSSARDIGLRRRQADLDERVEDAENRLDLLDGENGLLARVAKLDGTTETILKMLQMYLPNIDKKATRATSFWTIVAALTAIIVPIAVVMIAGYFSLKANLAHTSTTP